MYILSQEMCINASCRDGLAPLLFLDLCCCPLNRVASHIHFNAVCPFSSREDMSSRLRHWKEAAPLRKQLLEQLLEASHEAAVCWPPADRKVGATLSIYSSATAPPITTTTPSPQTWIGFRSLPTLPPSCRPSWCQLQQQLTRLAAPLWQLAGNCPQAVETESEEKILGEEGIRVTTREVGRSRKTTVAEGQQVLKSQQKSR